MMIRHTILQCLAVLILFIHSSAYADSLNFVVKGVTGDVKDNVEARLDLMKRGYGDQLSATDISRIYKAASNEITKGLQPYGYFKAKVISNINQNKDVWTATFAIDPGPELIIDSIDLRVDGEGLNNRKIKKTIASFPLTTGDKFNSETYEKAKEDLISAANNQGYINADFSQSHVYVDLKNYRAKIVLHLNTHHRYYFGTINFQETPYDNQFLKRFIQIKPGSPFSSDKLIALQQQMNNSFYFRRITITPEFEHSVAHHIPITVSASAPKSQRYQIGVGYGTITKARITAGMSLRRLTDTGQHFDAQLKLSQVISSITAKYYIPAKNPLTDQWIIGGNVEKFNPENGESISTTLSAGYVQKVKHLQTKIDLNYLYERYTVDEEIKRNSHLLYPSLDITYTKSNDLLNPTSGKMINLNLQAGYEGLFSSTSFLRAEIRGKYIYSPTRLSKLIFKGDLGYMLVHDIDSLPLTMRFFTGGTSSVRGYQESEIGPGRFLEMGSVEFQHKIYGNWDGAVFYDLGSANNHFNEHWRNGKGVGIIYESFIGPIRFYVAKGKKYGVEFSIGPEF